LNDLTAFDYPALYETAGNMSAESQTSFLRMIRGEYGLLILAAILSMNWSKAPGFFAFYVVVLLASLGVLIGRSLWKPEQGWYRGRALAESIKTSCWRYCMRAEPFGDAPTREEARASLREHLLDILRVNRSIGDRMPPDSAANDPIPVSMQTVRALPLEDRKTYYLEHRVKEQRIWYARKARLNKNASRLWFGIGVAAYSVGICLALARIVYPAWELWPIEPVIVFASAVIGWTQVKKFNELASSYTLTALEIGLIKDRIEAVYSATEFSEFINDAEQAFSREHTQWVARQQTE
jgi:hypothetical protein